MRLAGHSYYTGGIMSEEGRGFQGQKAGHLRTGRGVVAGTVAVWAAALNDEAWFDPVKIKTVVKAVIGHFGKGFDGDGSVLLEKSDDDATLAGFDGAGGIDGILRGGLGIGLIQGLQGRACAGRAVHEG